MSRIDYTLRIYKADKRTKTGEMHFGDYDYSARELKWMMEEIRELQNTLYKFPKFRIELHETWVTKTNLLSGKEYMERFDTPHYCSPSSESYWSM